MRPRGVTSRITNVRSSRGRVYESRFVAGLVAWNGKPAGPYLAEQFAKLDQAVAGDAAIESVKAMGREIADEWANRVPVLDANYRRAMQMPDVVRAGQVRSRKDPEGLQVIRGASGSVGPRYRPGVPDPVTSGKGETKREAQPALYAAALEFGQAVSGASGGFSRPQPSARPAFDAAQGRAIEAARRVLERAVRGIRP